jgi:hypothetical protein
MRLIPNHPDGVTKNITYRRRYYNQQNRHRQVKLADLKRGRPYKKNKGTKIADNF